MRKALGLEANVAPMQDEPKQQLVPPLAPLPPQPKKRASSGLRVTLRVTREFEGEILFVHDANTLSRLMPSN